MLGLHQESYKRTSKEKKKEKKDAFRRSCGMLSRLTTSREDLLPTKTNGVP